MWGNDDMDDAPENNFQYIQSNNPITNLPIQQGLMQYNIEGTLFALPPQYKPVKMIGRGSFGTVW